MRLLFLLAPALVIGVLMVLPRIERWALQGLPTRPPARVRATERALVLEDQTAAHGPETGTS